MLAFRLHWTGINQNVYLTASTYIANFCPSRRCNPGKISPESMPRKIQREEKTAYLPQYCLYFFLLPQGHGSLRPTFGPVRLGLGFYLQRRTAASLTTKLGIALLVLDRSL